MSKFSQGSKIIALVDAKDPTTPFPSDAPDFKNIERAYFKGDIFEVNRESIEDNSYMYTYIYHPILDLDLSVRSENFMLLEDWRVSQIDKIIN